MPKEKVRQGQPDTQPFEIVVGWQRDLEMQVGIGVQASRDSDEPDSLLKILYGPNDGALSAIGGRLRERLKAQGIELGPVDNTWLGKQTLASAESDQFPISSIWWTPTRYGVNQLIRLLRRARDAAYGRDE